MSSLEPMQPQKEEKKTRSFPMSPLAMYEHLKRYMRREKESKRRKKNLMKKIEEELETARKKGTKNKKAAIKALKRKKQFERQLLKVDEYLKVVVKQKNIFMNATNRADIDKAENEVGRAVYKSGLVWSINDKYHRIKDWNEEELENELEELLKEKNVPDVRQ